MNIQMIIAIYLVVINWLSYAKQIPIKPFLGIPFLFSGLIPALIYLGFWLYQPRLGGKISRQTITAFFLVIVAVLGLELAPSPMFSQTVNLATTTAVMPKFVPGLTTGVGVETAIAYLGVLLGGNDLLVYRALLVLVTITIFTMVVNMAKMPLKLNFRHWVSMILGMIFISVGLVKFNDMLTLLSFVLMSITLFNMWYVKSNVIFSGIIWFAILAINPMAGLCLVTPLALLSYPRQYLFNWLVAISINPLMIGGWL